MDRSPGPQRRGLGLRGVRRLAATVLGMSLALMAGCAAFPPTMAEVLDGPRFAGLRDAAAAQLEARSEAVIGRLGLSAVGAGTALLCWEGQNNWKVHEGYRFQCGANQISFLAWDGDFLEQQAKIVAVLTEECGPAKGGVAGHVPGPTYGFISGPKFDCGSGLGVETRWAARGVVDSSAGEFQRYCEQELVRCRQVVPAEVVFGEVSQRKWFMMLNVNTTFYTEPLGR